jgi:hypothetical protein
MRSGNKNNTLEESVIMPNGYNFEELIEKAL